MRWYLPDNEYGDKYGERGFFLPPEDAGDQTAAQSLEEYSRWTDPRGWQVIDNDAAEPRRNNEEVARLVQQVKPHFSEGQIETARRELDEKGYLKRAIEVSRTLTASN